MLRVIALRQVQTAQKYSIAWTDVYIEGGLTTESRSWVSLCYVVASDLTVYPESALQLLLEI